MTTNNKMMAIFVLFYDKMLISIIVVLRQVNHKELESFMIHLHAQTQNKSMTLTNLFVLMLMMNNCSDV